MRNTPFAPQRADPQRSGLLRQYVALRPHERQLITAALPLMLAVRLGLCFLSARRLQPLLLRLADATAAPQAHSDYAERAVRAVACAGRLVPGTDSLTRALATITLLRRRGLTAHLRLGICRTNDGALHRHAWVEYNGRVLMGGPASLVDRGE